MVSTMGEVKRSVIIITVKSCYEVPVYFLINMNIFAILFNISIELLALSSSGKTS